jgi:hypothetical protein
MGRTSHRPNVSEMSGIKMQKKNAEQRYPLQLADRAESGQLYLPGKSASPNTTYKGQLILDLKEKNFTRKGTIVRHGNKASLLAAICQHKSSGPAHSGRTASSGGENLND